MKAAKAIVGGLIAGLGSIGVALADSVMTYEEGFSAVVVTLIAFSTVYWVPNKTK